MRVQNSWKNRKDLAIEVVGDMTLEELKTIALDHMIDMYENNSKEFAADWVLYYMDEKKE